MMKVLSKTHIKSIAVTILFLFSSIGASVLINSASAATNSPSPLATTPLSSQEANWAYSNGNQFNQNYNPQHQINSSNAQNLGLAWLFPLPTHPAALLNVAGGLSVDSAPLIINGTIYAVTQFGQIFALNAANGNVIWTDILPLTSNSTLGKGVGALSLHLHDGAEQFTTKLFSHTPTFWISASDLKVYAINAINGQYELNFSVFDGPKTIAGNSPSGQYHGGPANVLIDENRGIAITSIISTNYGDTGRCFYRGWNILVSPPQLVWTAFCTPPQPGGSIPVDPNWEINQVNGMKGAEIFYPGPQYNGGGPIPSTAGVNLKTLSPSQLNATLYNDWGYINQTPACLAYDNGASTGSTGAAWGGPWLLGSGPSSGLAFVNTNNKDPYGNSSCSPGPNLWSAAILALNVTTGQWVWGFQGNAHDVWDYDCSWWQALGNETVNGANTQVIWKTCKAGYLFELNAQTGALIWAWTPPTSIEARCPYCYMLDPLNKTQMNQIWFNPTSTQPTICTPCTFSFESEAAYNPATNEVYVVSINNPQLWYFVPFNATNYHTSGGTASFPVPGQTKTEGSFNNATVEAVNAATGQMVWSHFVPNQGYRGGLTTSGNIVYLTLSSGDIVMLNAATGQVVKDLYIGGPLNVLPSIGATASGQMMVIFPIDVGAVSWGTAVPGDLIALTLQQPAGGGTTTVTSSVTSTTTVSGGTVTSTSTVSGGATVTTTVSGGATVTTTVGAGSTATVTTASGGVDPTLLYGVAAVAVIFIIATGFLAMRGRRKPAP